MSLGPLYVFLGEVSIQVFCPFFSWIVCLPGVESCEFFMYFGNQALVRGLIGKYIFPYGWFPFHFAAVFFSHAKALYFDEVSFVYCSFMSLALGNITMKMLLHGISEISLHMFSSRTFIVLQKDYSVPIVL